MQNTEVSRILGEIADLLELKGGNDFRVRAYHNAQRAIEGLSEPLTKIHERGELDDIDGVGKSIAEKIRELLNTGRLAYYEELKQEFPEGLMPMMDVNGMGPKKVKLVYEQLGVSSIDELKQAAEAGQLASLPGLGKKTEEKILKGIADLEKSQGRFTLKMATATARDLLERIRNVAGVEKAEAAGSLRRGKETVGDLDILVATKNPSAAMEAFLATDSRKETLWQGESKSSIVLNTGLQVDLRVVPRESFGAAMQYFTGSKAHNVKLRERAVARKLKVNEYGVFQEGEEQPLAGQTEESVYEALGLVWIPPELREGLNEIDLAEQDNLPPLLEEKHIRGALHNHTTDSDGRLNLEELVEEAKARGYHYLAVTDHSSTLSVARGLDSARLRKQIEQIRSFNQKHPDFPVLAGSEVDIRTDGTLDFSDDDLAQLDFVIAAIHSQFNLSQADMTKRICSALANPYVDLLAHPTGRLVARREGFAVDREALYQTAAETGTALEINAQDMRLDLRDQHIREAKAYGIVFSINTDTHAASDFDHLAFGVGTARRARLQKEDVINTWTLKQLQTWQRKRKG